MSSVFNLAFAKAPNLSLREKIRLFDQFGNSEVLQDAIQKSSKSRSKYTLALKEIHSSIDIDWAKSEMARLADQNMWILCYGDSNYPEMLSKIPDPPLVLIGRGKWFFDQYPHIGFVGPRKPSAYGKRVAKLLSKDLAREGLLLVSGLALGVDSIAHQSSISEHMPTIAVVANGLDQVYPRENLALQEKIIDSGGAVITEFFLGQKPFRNHFPRRNRIISGLSSGVVVVEAGEKSGARTTARHAIEQNREVYAVPGPIDAPLSYYTNQLISEGAKMVRSTDDILEDFEKDVPNRHRPKRVFPKSQLTKSEIALLSIIEVDHPLSPDQISRRAGQEIQKTLEILSNLEMKGMVEKNGDANFLKVVSIS